MRIGYAPGVWDLCHSGHLNLLRAARTRCDLLVVGVLTDDGAAAYKRRPFMNEDMRLDVIRSLRMVDAAVLQPSTDPTPQLEVVRPNLLFHGDDWDRLREGHGTLAALGIEFVLLPYTPGISTSELIAGLMERGMAVTR